LLPGLVLFLVLILANLILYPVDTLIRNYYLYTAARKLKAFKPIVIGITGSFGKTSTKHILANILADHYEVLSTPKSYNTLMGICKVINEDLTSRHRYFIVEMGAYKAGEIEKICQLVRPVIGILTAVGPQHIERFLTLENIAKAKYELIEALPASGTAIFNNDNAYCRQLADKTHLKTLRYGLENQPKSDLRAGSVQVDLKGTRFEVSGAAGPALTARMQLLGRQNVSNALGAILAAMECGITLEQAVRSLLVIPAFEHRMQLIQLPNGISLIDNAYSSNPESALYSFEVFKAIEVPGRKILITPGFAEQGSKEEEEHYKLGQEAARVSDYVFLVGNENRVGPIRRGLLDGNFAGPKIFVHPSMNETRTALSSFAQPGDLILIENDLPDVY
jgi:UDP-N-acetylmuramoyl-tripeptide--D-alanyl-D-alanine ligase